MLINLSEKLANRLTSSFNYIPPPKIQVVNPFFLIRNWKRNQGCYKNIKKIIGPGLDGGTAATLKEITKLFHFYWNDIFQKEYCPTEFKKAVWCHFMKNVTKKTNYKLSAHFDNFLFGQIIWKTHNIQTIEISKQTYYRQVNLGPLMMLLNK